MSILEISKIIVALILIFFSLNLASGRNITIEYPKEVSYGEEFSVNVKLEDFTSDSYDLKIDIFGGETRISKIWDNEIWKSTNYYVNKVISPGEDSARLNLNITTKYSGKAEMTVKIRNSKSSVNSFTGYSIDVLYKEPEETKKNEDTGGEVSNKVDAKKEEQEIDKEEDLEQSDEINSVIGNAIKDNEITEETQVQVIKLVPKDIKSNEIWKSQTGKIKEYSLVGFALFCFIMLIALLKWQKKYNKGEI